MPDTLPPAPGESSSRARFLADLSHEVRSPLNAIIGFSELLADEMLGPLNEQQAEVVTDILAASRHLLRLVTDVLDISKIHEGRMSLQPQALCLAAAVEEAVVLSSGTLSSRAVPQVPRTIAVQADERRLVQILCNLLANAICYSPADSPIEVTAREDGPLVCVSVHDSGCGIAPEDQERIFEEFVSISHPGYTSGTGLGLAVTRRLVRLMGGTISVSSAPGKGSTFSFTLPAAELPPDVVIYPEDAAE